MDDAAGNFIDIFSLLVDNSTCKIKFFENKNKFIQIVVDPATKDLPVPTGFF